MDFRPKFVDLVRNVTAVQGTGPVALGSAVSGYTSLADTVGEGDQFYYCIQGVDRPDEHEVGRGTMQADGTVARDPIGGAFTDFSSGAKTIALVAPAEWFAKLEQLSGLAGQLGVGPDERLIAASSFDVGARLSVGEDAGVAGDLVVGGNAFAQGNLTVGGALNVASATPAFGPQSGPASDCNLFIDNTNYNGFIFFRSWNAGAPQLDGWLRGRRGVGLELNSAVGVALQCDGSTIARASSSALEIADGKVLKIGASRVVATQQPPIANDASGLANQTTINAILEALRNHGLIAS